MGGQTDTHRDVVVAILRSAPMTRSWHGAVTVVLSSFTMMRDAQS